MRSHLKCPAAHSYHVYYDNSKLSGKGSLAWVGRSTYVKMSEVILSPRPTARARALAGEIFPHPLQFCRSLATYSIFRCTPPSLLPLASLLSLPFGLRHRFPSLLPFLSIHRGDFFQHPSVSLESRREEKRGGRAGREEEKIKSRRGEEIRRPVGVGSHWGERFQSTHERMGLELEGMRIRKGREERKGAAFQLI